MQHTHTVSMLLLSKRCIPYNHGKVRTELSKTLLETKLFHAHDLWGLYHGLA